MKELIITLALMTFASYNVSSFGDVKYSDTQQGQVIEVKEERNEKYIRQVAYNYLGEDSRKTVINGDTATVEEYKIDTEHQIAGKDKPVDLKGMEVYKVTFNTSDEQLLGPIVIYIEKASLKTLGLDYRH